MLDILLLAAATITVSWLALNCCGPPSSKISFNPSSNPDQGFLPMDGESTPTPRKGITVVEKPNINNDVKERTLEDEKKERRRKTGNRERVSRSTTNRARKSKQSEDKKDKQKPKKSSPVEGDEQTGRKVEKKVEKKKSRSRSAIWEPNPLLVSSSDPFSKHSEVQKRDKKEGEKVKEREKIGVGMADDESTKDPTPGSKDVVGSKDVLDDSRKAATAKASNEKMQSNERVGTNETMLSRDRLDEVDSAKMKQDPFSSQYMQVADTQIDSEKPKKFSQPARSPPNPPMPKKRVNKKKEEEVRNWNAMVAKGTVFRPRKDDETIDEVNVDWNS